MVVYTDTTKGLLHEGHHTGPAGRGGLDAYREATYLEAGDRELIQVGQLFNVAVGLVAAHPVGLPDNGGIVVLFKFLPLEGQGHMVAS